jgi:alkylation response protein AidB-like acyl-CoA dehydrogenase
VVEPVLESCILPGLYLGQGGTDKLRQAWLEPLMTGEKRIAIAQQEMHMRGPLGDVRTTAKADGGSVILNGEKAYCFAGGQADAYLISARSDSSAETVLYLVPTDSAGLEVDQWRVADGTWMASLSLKDVKVPSESALSLESGAAEHIEKLASLARSSEVLGIMEAMFAETLEYLRTREQFGTSLGSFQALQHRMAEQYARLEQSRALIELAIVSDGSDAFAKNVDGARAFIAEFSLELGHEMIQFHGGMGVTDELAIGQGHKRILVLSRWPEQPLATLDRFATMH